MSTIRILQNVGVLAAILMVSVCAFATEEQPLVPGDLSFARQNPALQIVSNNPSLTTISLSNPDILMADSMVAFEPHQMFAIPGEALLYDDARPSIPQISRFYRIPNTGSVDLVLTNSDYELVNGVNPLPMNVKGTDFDPSPRKDPSVYEEDVWFPAEPVQISEPMIFRDFRVVRVTLYPVQVNASRRQARMYSNLSVDLVANDTPGENELLNPSRPSRAWASTYRNTIANLDEHALDDITVDPGTYLILCKENVFMNRLADTLAYLKRRQGFDVVVDRRTSWTQGQMSGAVQTLYNASNPKLEFVCIIGDPADNAGLPTGGGEYDHAFADPAGNDDLEDVGVGRISAIGEAQVNLAIAKIYSYESNPYYDDPSWFRKAFLYAGVTSGFSSNRILMNWARQQFYFATQKDTVYVATHSGNVNNTLIAQRFNEGIAFFLWRGTVVGEMNGSAPGGTNNGFKMPVCLAITCGSGDFTNGVGLNESFFFQGTPTNPKAGICGIGTATFGTHVQYNNTVAGGLVYGICNLDIEYLGTALASAKAQLLTAFPNDGTAMSFVYWNNLIGEPGMSMWTRQPTAINVSYPATVNVGTRRVRPQVTDATTGDPIPDALVVLWKGTETYSRILTDAGGFIDVPVTVNTPGTMTITVTKRNHKPVYGNITCVAAPQMVSLSSYTIDDDNSGGTSGNGDGHMNPGETIDLPVYLRNFGSSATGTDVTAVLTSSDPGVNITTPNASFPNVAPNDSVLGSSFRVSVSPLLVDGSRILFTLQVTASGQTTHSSFIIECEAGIGSYISRAITGGDGDAILEPNETVNMAVTIRNTGDLVMTNTSGTLRSNSTFVSVISPQTNFGTIAVNANATSQQSFIVRAHPLSYPGHIARMQLFLTSNGGHQDTVLFSLPVGTISGTDPTGPDAYGYYAYENGDHDASNERWIPLLDTLNTAYVNISSAGGENLDINDIGEQDGSSGSYSRVRTLPFPFTFYGETYTQITICSNGWAAFGSQGDQDHFRNYPIPGQQSPHALLAPFWDDLKTNGSNQGEWVYHDQVNHRYIIQWKAQHAQNTSNLDFEILLLDPAFYPTRDGNGIVVFQYNTISEFAGFGNDIHYSTIGIEKPGNLVGLQYRFMNQAAPGAQSLVAERRVIITTEARTAFGTITGMVTDAEDGMPLSDVIVSLDGEGYRDTTDVAGQYTLSNVLIGEYTVRCKKTGFNDATATNIVVELDSTETVNFSMVHPEIELSTTAIEVSLPDDPIETSFDIINNGNGPLDYSISVEFVADGNHIDPWDSVAGIAVSQTTGDPLVQGVEFVGDYWWVTGGGNGKQFYRYLFADGSYAGSIPQPGHGALGWFDMAYDGNLIYGSGDENIYGVDQQGVVRDTISGPCNPNRAIAYDPQTSHFWVMDRRSDLYEINRSGQIFQRFRINLDVTGLAWHAGDIDGFHLYAFAQDSTHQNSAVWRIHPVTGTKSFVATLGNGPNERAGGCTITSNWNNTLVVFAGVLQSSVGDRLVVHDVAFNTSWITVTPSNSNVAPDTRRQISVAFNPAGLRPFTYRVNLLVDNNSITPQIVLPVTLEITTDSPERPERVPLQYALAQNFPNPFNSSTTFSFELRQEGFSTLRVYNLMGQKVADVISGHLAAGEHTVNFDMNGLATGQYIYVLESGDFREARKMLLLK